jgi:hypothetical protein
MSAGRTDSPDDQLVKELLERTGTYVMGRRIFNEGEVGWPENPPFRARVCPHALGTRTVAKEGRHDILLRHRRYRERPRASRDRGWRQGRASLGWCRSAAASHNCVNLWRAARDLITNPVGGSHLYSLVGFRHRPQRQVDSTSAIATTLKYSRPAVRLLISGACRLRGLPPKHWLPPVEVRTALA